MIFSPAVKPNKKYSLSIYQELNIPTTWYAG